MVAMKYNIFLTVLFTLFCIIAAIGLSLWGEVLGRLP